MQQGGARPLDAPLPANTSAIFVDTIGAGAKGLARPETLIKPNDGRNIG